MEITFTNASFIYKKTNHNIYGVQPVHVTTIPDTTNDSPFIIELFSELYEKCVYLNNINTTLNFYFILNGEIINDVVISSSEDFLKIEKHNQFFTITIEQNNSISPRYSTILASHNTGVLTFKIFQDRINPLISFEKVSFYEYKGVNDTIPVIQSENIQVSGNNLEYFFNTLDERTSNKKQVLKVFCDVFLKKDNYIVNEVEKYVIDDEYDGQYTEIPVLPEYGTPSSPKYVLSQGKMFIKTTGLKNGKNTPIYKEGVIIGNEVFYKVNYDNQFVFNFNEDGSLNITNYGRCFMEKKAFYIVKLSHKYSPKFSATIKLNYIV